MTTLVADRGCAVGRIEIAAPYRVNAVKLHFVRVNEVGLLGETVRKSAWYPRDLPSKSEHQKLGNNQPIVSVSGIWSRELRGLNFLTVSPEHAPAR